MVCKALQDLLDPMREIIHRFEADRHALFPHRLWK
jgi:hypothetical protein